ncbi:MAG: di-trans,poly-cis-decaprenylcistransferase [Planctomycetes bacterium]|nr:di-trans,poly-cis-decaprenylcistransferase [Planctomycetota bacterium]
MPQADASPIAPRTIAPLPRHIAIIMDGNGRWAQRRGLARVMGHHEGSKTVRGMVTACAERKIEALTLYSFSSENWSRPEDEVAALMTLLKQHLTSELPLMLKNGIKFRRLGRREGISADVLELLDETERATAHGTGMTLTLALNYGARAEMVDAVHAIAAKAKAGELDPARIDEATIAAHLGTAGLPDPDLLIRTAGQMRVSNFLLWQIGYAELHVTETLWPDFGVEDLECALRDFAGRQRTFGGLQVK